MKVYKSNIKITDSFNNPLEVKEGYWLRNLLKADRIWENNEITAAFNKFKNSDFGNISDFERARNNKAIELGKGTVVGVYEKDNDGYNDLIISYNPKTDIVHLLSRYDYETHPIAWEEKVERYGKTLYDPAKDIKAKASFTEEGRQYNKSQRAQIKNQLVKEYGDNKELKGIIREILEETYRISEPTDEQIEAKIKVLTAKNYMDRINAIVEKYDVDLKDVIERVMYLNGPEHRNLEQTISIIEKNADKPYFFADNKTVKDSIITVDEKGIATAFVGVKNGRFKTTKDSNIKLSGRVSSKGLWKNFADSAEVKKENVNVEFVGTINNEDYYKVECKFDIKSLEDSKVRDMFEPIDSFKTFEFMDKTHQGFKVIKAFEDLKDNRMHVIVYRPATEDYVVGVGYSPDDGYWNQGYYGFKSVEDAEDALRENYKVVYYNNLKDIDDVYIEDEEVEEEMHTCEYCGEDFPESELHCERDLGWLCHDCCDYLESKGEKLYLDKYLKDSLKGANVLEYLKLREQLGLDTEKKVIEFSEKHGNVENEELLEAMRKEANKLTTDDKPNHEVRYFIAAYGLDGEYYSDDYIIKAGDMAEAFDQAYKDAEDYFAGKRHDPHEVFANILPEDNPKTFMTYEEAKKYLDDENHFNDSKVKDSIEKFYLGFEAEDDFDDFDSTELDERIEVADDELSVREALKKAASQILQIREVEGEFDIEEMDPDDWYSILFKKVWVENEDGSIRTANYQPTRLKKYFK